MIKKVLCSQMFTNRIYSIEGNIGCGKSTILDYITLKNKQNILCIQEPVTEWTNMNNGTDLLKLFYEKKDRWSFCFENLVQLSRLKTHFDCKNYLANEQNKTKNLKLFMERSIFSSYYVFAQNSYDEKGLNKIEFDILTKYFELFANQLCENSNRDEMPFKTIYIKSTPEICLKRIKYRNRDSETSIDLNYLKRLDSKYENWISNLADKDLIVLDGNLEKEKVLNQIDQLLFI